jgi:hypothetical protein
MGEFRLRSIILAINRVGLDVLLKQLGMVTRRLRGILIEVIAKRANMASYLMISLSVNP